MSYAVWKLGDGEYDFKDVPQSDTIKIHGVYCESDRAALRMARAVSSDKDSEMAVVEVKQPEPLTLKDVLCHYLNSLHVFCGLLRLGLSRKKARWVARKYERIVHLFLY